MRKPQTLPGKLWTYTPLVLALGLRLASGPTANLSYLLLAVYASLGSANVIRALALSWLFTMINPGIAPDASAASVGRYVVLISAAGGIFIRENPLRLNYNISKFTFYTLLVVIFIIIHSFIFSYVPDVSILKISSWAIAMISIASAWISLSEIQAKQIKTEVFVFMNLILLAGLPLIRLPSGYLTNGTGYQGLLNQPQVFGVFVTLLGVWTLARILTERTPSWWLFGIAGMCAALIFMSESRTAGLALFLSITISPLALFILSSRPLLHIAPALRNRRIWMIIGIIIATGIVLAPRVISTAEHFLTKSDRAEISGLLDAYSNSRGILISPMLENITEHSLTGIGFGIASKPQEMEIQRDPLLGLPIGAAVEKGVMPIMILEELGIVGFSVIFLWISAIVYRSSFGGLEPFSVCIAILILNLGEASLFSPGGMGLLTMILLGWSVSHPSKHRQGNTR